MKICVVKPSMFGEQVKDALTPLLFAVLKRLTPNEYETAFDDDRIEAIDYDRHGYDAIVGTKTKTPLRFECALL